MIATGHTLLAGSAPTGEAVDRATAIAPGATGAAILLDELSAGLLDGRCRVRALGAGVFALDRVVLAAGETRPLLGKPTPCVGRDAELAMLDIALAACRDDPVRGAAGGLLAQALRPVLGVAEAAAPDEARGALLAAGALAEARGMADPIAALLSGP